MAYQHQLPIDTCYVVERQYMKTEHIIQVMGHNLTGRKITQPLMKIHFKCYILLF